MKCNIKSSRGITLIELLIVLVIIAVLATIAIPAYDSQARKSRRSEAKAALSTIALAQERYFTINGRYATDFTVLDLSSGTFDSVGNSAIVTESEYYNISSIANNTAYLLNATAAGGQASDNDCSWFAMSHLGVKTASNSVCW